MPTDTAQDRLRLIDIARAVAIAAHAGQVDKAGEPYWTHPQRVAATFTNDVSSILLPSQQPTYQFCAMIAWLHDVVEDTNVTAEDLTAIGFPYRVVLAVQNLTRQDNETYEQFIDRVAVDDLARRVKLADLADNLDPSRRWQPGATHRARYLRAQEKLSSATTTALLREA